MPLLFYLLLFIFGTAVGSFLNVLIWRYVPEGKLFSWLRLSGRSHCPYCSKTLEWYELVPILSFILQGGRCYSCRHKLSLQYPLVEAAAGLIFVLVPWTLAHFYGLSQQLFVFLNAPRFYYGLSLVWVAIFLVFLVIMVIDLRHYLIPDELNSALIILGIILTLVLLLNKNILPPFHESFLKHYALIFSPTQNLILNRLLGIGLGLIFFGALSILSLGRAMGFGDVKLAFATGFVFGWPDIALVIILAFIIGGIFGVFLI